MRVAAFVAFVALTQGQHRESTGDADGFNLRPVNPWEFENGWRNEGVSIRRQRADPDSIVFPGRTRAPSELSVLLQLAKEISNSETVEEYLSKVDGAPPPETIIGSRFNGERANVVRGKLAMCMPEMTVVSVKENLTDSAILYIPACIRVKRCGGCCTHALLSCQPVEKEVRNYEVFLTNLITGTLTYKQREIVPIEEHTKCKCDCRVKAEHCSEKQVYVEDECRCACTNVDEEEKCKMSNSTKLWYPDLCVCLCRTTENCNTGYYFNQSTCSCVEVLKGRRPFNKSRIPNSFRKSAGSSNIPIVFGVNADDPRRKPKDDPEYK